MCVGVCVEVAYAVRQRVGWLVGRRDLGVLTRAVYVTDIQIMGCFAKIGLLLLLLLFLLRHIESSSMNIPFGITCSNRFNAKYIDASALPCLTQFPNA